MLQPVSERDKKTHTCFYPGTKSCPKRERVHKFRPRFHFRSSLDWRRRWWHDCTVLASKKGPTGPTLLLLPLPKFTLWFINITSFWFINEFTFQGDSKPIFCKGRVSSIPFSPLDVGVRILRSNRATGGKKLDGAHEVLAKKIKIGIVLKSKPPL